MIEHSTNFIQVDRNTCVKKEKVGLNDEKVTKIKDGLTNYISRFNEIDLRDVTIYEDLPETNFARNKYLLAGIIRTYFGNTFNIKYTDRTYRGTEFIVTKNS